MKTLKNFIIEGFTKTDPKRLSGYSKWKELCAVYIGCIYEFSYKSKDPYTQESWELFNDYILDEILTDKEKEKFAKVKEGLLVGNRPITPTWVANYLASLVYHFGLDKLYSKLESWQYKHTIITVPKKSEKEKYYKLVDELMESVSPSMRKVVNWNKAQK